MQAFVLDLDPHNTPLATTSRATGDVPVRCSFCGISSIVPYSKKPRQTPVEIAIVFGAGRLGDVEQAGTILLASKRFRAVVTEKQLTGIEFYDPVGFKIQTKKKQASRILDECKNILMYQVI